MDLLFIWFVFLCSVLCSDHHRLSLHLLTVVFWEFRRQKKRQKSLWWQSESRIWICGSRNEPVWIKRLLTLIQRGSLANGSLRERAGGFIKALLFHTAEHSAATLAAASSCCDVHAVHQSSDRCSRSGCCSTWSAVDFTFMSTLHSCVLIRATTKTSKLNKPEPTQIWARTFPQGY